MPINYYDNTKKIVETNLTKVSNEMFIRLRMGRADWDMDATLRATFSKPSNIDKIKDLIQIYDKQYEKAVRSNIHINEEYKVIYKLE